MLRTLALQIKGFKKDAILTPICMILEVLFETMIPFLMASIIDKGVEAGDIGHIYRIGGVGRLRPAGWSPRRAVCGPGFRRLCQELAGSHVCGYPVFFFFKYR